MNSELVLKINGTIESTNFDTFKSDVLEMVRAADLPLISDIDFYNAEESAKSFKKAELAIRDAKDKALSDTADIYKLFSDLDEISSVLRETRLKLEKDVKKEKSTRKKHIVDVRCEKLEKAISATDLPTGFVAVTRSIFEDAIKGKKKLESMEKALDLSLESELDMLVTICETAKNAGSMIDDASENYSSLFPDRNTLLSKGVEELAAIIDGRIAKFKLEEKEKAELEAKRKVAKELAEKEAKEKADLAEKESKKENGQGELFEENLIEVPPQKENTYNTTHKKHHVQDVAPDPVPEEEKKHYKIVVEMNCTLAAAKEAAAHIRGEFINHQMFSGIKLTSE